MRAVALGDVCQVTTGQSAPQEASAFGSTGTPFVRAGSLERLCDGESEDSLELVPAEQAAKYRLKTFPKDTVVFAKSGMSAKVGRVYRLRRDCHVVSHLAAILPSNEVDPGYLHRWLQHSPPSRLIENDAYPSIKTSTLERIKIPLPALAKQRHVAAILDKADALRGKRREAIAKLDQLLHSVFLDMFGDPRVNPRGFPLRNLSDFYIDANEGTRCGPFGSALKRSDVTQSGVPLWNMDNISNAGQMQLPFRAWVSEEKARDLASYGVLDGDILISRAGTVGKMCVVRAGVEKSLITTNLIRLRLGPALVPEFFVGLMTHCKGRVGRLRTGPDGAFTHMSTGVLDTLLYPHPPIDLQRSWVVRSAAIQTQKAQMSDHFDLMNKQFESMTERVFSGATLA